ncbi:unnamed protein product [Leuciscus chuanchicus]
MTDKVKDPEDTTEMSHDRQGILKSSAADMRRSTPQVAMHLPSYWWRDYGGETRAAGGISAFLTTVRSGDAV